MMPAPFACPACGRTGIELGVPGEIVAYHDRSLGYDLYNVQMLCGCGAGSCTSMAIFAKDEHGKIPVIIDFDEYQGHGQTIYAPVKEEE